MNSPIPIRLTATSSLAFVRNRAIYLTTYFGFVLFASLAFRAFQVSDWVVSSTNVIGMIICVLTGYWSRRPTPPSWFTYPFAVYLLGFVWYLMLSGYRDGIGVVWMLVVPVLAMFALGTRMGILVSILNVPVLLYCFFVGETLSETLISMEFRTRLVVVYMVSATFCFTYSYASDRYERSLRRARERIVGLEKMLPICAYCKNVRHNDQWDSIETYLGDQSDLQVSHGICPDCLHTHFAEDMPHQQRK